MPSDTSSFSTDELRQIVSAAFRALSSEWLLEYLENSSDDYYLVGGAVRDVLIGSPPNDLDIAIPNGSRSIHELLSPIATGVKNRHGNWRFEFPRGFHVDLIEPVNFYRRFSTVDQMLKFFDVSVNAVGVHVKSGQVLDPLDGTNDLAMWRVVLPEHRWSSMDDFESVHLTLRTLRLLKRYEFAVANPETLLAQLPKFDRVDWRELYRLNGITPTDARIQVSTYCPELQLA